LTAGNEFVQTLKGDSSKHEIEKSGIDFVFNFLDYRSSIKFKKWIVGILLGVVAITSGLLSFSELKNQNSQLEVQNNLLKDEILSNNHISIAQLKLDLKEDYINWDNSRVNYKKFSNYTDLVKHDTMGTISNYWSKIVRQEYEALKLSKSKSLNEFFDHHYLPIHKHAVRYNPMLDSARIDYICQHSEELKSKSSYGEFFRYLKTLKWNCEDQNICSIMKSKKY